MNPLPVGPCDERCAESCPAKVASREIVQPVPHERPAVWPVTSGKGANMIDLVPAVVGIDPAVVRAEVLTRLRALAPVDAAPSPSPDPLDRARQLAADIARHDEIAAELVTLRARILAAMGGVA